LFLLYVPDADPWWTVCLAMVGKFQIAASFAVIYVYAGELMPTVVRSQVQEVKNTKKYPEKTTFCNLCLYAGHGNIFFCGGNWPSHISLHQQSGGHILLLYVFIYYVHL
jgi:hypothetical protein